MATRGRKPRPTSLKVLAGDRADRVNTAEPSPVAGAPPCPEHVAEDPRAREAWDRLIPLLDRMGVLSQADGSALEIYCTAYSRWRKALESIRSQGLTVYTDKGSEKTNPAVSIAAQAEAAMGRILACFGCTPSDRGRLRVGAKEKKDGLSEFLARRKA